MHRNISEDPQESPRRKENEIPIRTDQVETNQTLHPWIITSIYPCRKKINKKNTKIYDG